MFISSGDLEAAGAPAPDAADRRKTYFFRVALLVLAYYVMGRLGLTLAVPPGYATVIWPPSGIALAALILYGARLWPGIFCGSLLLNLQVAGALSLEALAGDGLWIAMGIAAGSTLQTLFARFLVRATLGIPISLRDWQGVLKLLVLAGPVGCLLAATIGVATMYAFGVLPQDRLVGNWLTWWKGDTFGVLVFLPLILIAPGGAVGVRWRERQFGALPAAAVLALLVPLGLTFYAWKVLVHYRYEKNAAQFATLAREGEVALLRRIGSYKDALLGGAGFFRGSEYVSRREWRQYVEAIDIGRSYPGMNGIGWADAVAPHELSEYVARMRAEGSPEFSVHPSAVPQANFVISYLEPERDNLAALGLNIAFEKNRYEAAVRARDTGNVALTRRIRLVQDESRGVGFLFLLPVYESGLPTTTVAERRAALRGWIIAPLLAKALLQGLGNSPGWPLNMTVYDGTEAAQHLIFSSEPLADAHPIYVIRQTINVGGQNWLLVWKSTPEFERLSANYEHLLVLAGGLLLTFLFAVFLTMITRRAETVQQLVRQRTQELQQSEEALRSSEETFRSAMEHASIGMALVTPSGTFLRVNQALCNLLGYTAFELEGRTFQSITHPEDLQISNERMEEALHGATQSYQIEKRYLHKDGHAIWTLLNASLLRRSDGSPMHFIAQIQDITQRRQVDRMKREFISTVSHELRTPLTSIRGSLGLIASGVLGQLPQKIESMIRIAHTNSERLVRIINDILDIEKIESGKLELSLRKVPIAAFLRQALEANDAYGAKFNVRFVLQAVPDDATVMADPDRLMQVMANLLSNAAKFSPQGSQVAVRAKLDGTDVRIEVEDHGTGIPEEFRSRIFDKFAQADSSTSRRFEGTGLGLSITRQLVQAMGGTIGFATETGIGTTFHVELPCLEATERSGLSDTAVMRILICGERTGTEQDRKLHRVLHVEDDLDLCKVIDTALAGRAQVVATPSVRDAQQLLRAGQFSLVMLDLGLPDGNGLTLLNDIENLATGPVPVVILSASEVSREVQQRVAATLVKSRMSEARVVETILNLVGQGEQPGLSGVAKAK